MFPPILGWKYPCEYSWIKAWYYRLNLLLQCYISIERTAIYSTVLIVLLLVLPSRERKKFSQNLIYGIYKFSSSQYYSSLGVFFKNIFKIPQISASNFFLICFYMKRKQCIFVSRFAGCFKTRQQFWIMFTTAKIITTILRQRFARSGEWN